MMDVTAVNLLVLVIYISYYVTILFSQSINNKWQRGEPKKQPHIILIIADDLVCNNF